MKKITYALLASTFLVSAASAEADSSASADPKTCANFNGFYAGWLIGYGSGSGNTKSYTTDPAGAIRSNNSQISIDGWNTGITAGYGKAMGNKVYLGLDLNYTFDSAQGKAAAIKVDEKDSFELAARVGGIVANALPYIKFGYINAHVNGQYQGPTGGNRKYLDDRLNGWLVGAGIDFKISAHLVGGLDYTYSHLPGHGKPLVYAVAGGNETFNSKTQLDDNKVRVKIAYQF